MRRRLAAPAALAVLTLGLAACAGDDGTGPVTEAPPTLIDNDDASDGGGGSDGGGSEASDGGGSTEAAPDIPAPDPDDYPGMDEETPEGAEQAFKYFMDMGWWGHQTGSSETLRGLSTENCLVCNNALDDIDQLAANGEYWSEFETNVVSVSSQEAPNEETSSYVVSYIADNGEHQEPNENFDGEIEVPAQRYYIAAGMAWVDGKWLVDGMSVDVEDV